MSRKKLHWTQTPAGRRRQRRKMKEQWARKREDKKPTVLQAEPVTTQASSNPYHQVEDGLNAIWKSLDFSEKLQAISRFMER